MVPAAGSRDDLVILAEWTEDTEVTGAIPLKISCHTGSLVFVNILMSHFASVTDHVLIEENDPLPSGYKEVIDASTGQRFAQKVLVPAESNMVQPWLQQLVDDISDGKNNVIIDGKSRSRHDIVIWNGPWHWPIVRGNVFECDITVDIPPELSD
jgi:hypothetical protein